MSHTECRKHRHHCGLQHRLNLGSTCSQVWLNRVLPIPAMQRSRNTAAHLQVKPLPRSHACCTAPAAARHTGLDPLQDRAVGSQTWCAVHPADNNQGMVAQTPPVMPQGSTGEVLHSCSAQGLPAHLERGPALLSPRLAAPRLPHPHRTPGRGIQHSICRVGEQEGWVSATRTSCLAVSMDSCRHTNTGSTWGRSSCVPTAAAFPLPPLPPAATKFPCCLLLHQQPRLTCSRCRAGPQRRPRPSTAAARPGPQSAPGSAPPWAAPAR